MAYGFYGPVGRAWEFAAGAALALGVFRARSRRGLDTGRRILAIAGLALLLASFWIVNETMPFPGPWTLLPVAATVLLIWGGGAGGPASRLLSVRPLTWIGDRSYSWYLWHWPLIVFASVLWPGEELALFGAALVSLLPAAASYALVEQPMRAPRAVSRRRSIALVGAVVLPTVAI